MIKQRDVLSLPDGEYNIARGLYLLVKNNGASRSWVLATKVAGKRFRRGVGSARSVTMAQAKLAAEALRVSLRTQNNGATTTSTPFIETSAPPTLPSHLLEQDTYNRKSVDAPLFKDCYSETIEHFAKVCKWANAEAKKKNLYYRLETYIIPIIGNVQINKITTADVANILSPIWTTMHPTAEEIRAFLFRVFKRYTKLGYYPKDKTNPATWEDNLDEELAEASKVHATESHPAPTFKELQDAIPKLLEIKTPVSYAIVFGILTVCRQQEFLEIKQGEVDFHSAVWQMPKIRRKDRNKNKNVGDFLVPLSKQAILILKEYKNILPLWIENKKQSAKKHHKTFVPPDLSSLFPGVQDGAEFINQGTINRLLRKVCGRKVDMHGCRSTFSDWCAENKKDRETAEKALMHETGNKVERTYKRTALLEQRRVLMQEWADAIMTKTDL